MQSVIQTSTNKSNLLGTILNNWIFEQTTKKKQILISNKNWMRKLQKSNYALIAKCILEINYPTAGDWESALRQAMSIFARELLFGADRKFPLRVNLSEPIQA